MAADQYKKRLNSVSHLTCYSGEKYRAKRKKFGSSQYDSNMKTHISLEWNGNQKKVIAKREQVGLSWKNFQPFVDYFPHGCSPIADVYAVPKEIYELENLNGVLSYEVWENHLSENERKHLLQFLPGGPEAEQVVQQLLAGDDFHFGNPFLKWGASICSGDLHPDAIFLQDRNLKIEKKAYYSDLHKYHHEYEKFCYFIGTYNLSIQKWSIFPNFMVGSFMFLWQYDWMFTEAEGEICML